MQITYECVSLTFHPFGTALVAGSVEGYLIILNAENGSVVSSVRVCGSALTCMGFNPGNINNVDNDNTHIQSVSPTS